MQTTLFALAATGMTFGERAAYAGKMFLIGFGAVFGVLALLWGVLTLFHYIASTGERRAEARKPLRTPVPVPPEPPAPEASAPTDEGALVAVLTAAVAAAMAEEKDAAALPGFRVVSYRKL